MAGKRKRKRQIEPRKKDSKQKKNTDCASFEDKKPKFDDELNKQFDEDLQQWISGRKDEGESNSVSEDPSSSPRKMEAEECKYIPPFTRKSKIILKTDGSSIFPGVGSERTKQPWKDRERNFIDTQRSPRSQKTRVEESLTNDSPKRKKEKESEEEMQVHVEGMERVVMLGHEKKDLPLASTSWTVAADAKGKNSLMSNGTLLSCPSSTIQEDVSAIVMQVIDNLLETVIRHGNQCNDEALEEQMVKAGSQTLLADVNEAVAAATTVMEGQEHCCSAIKTTMIGERETPATICMHKDKVGAVPVKPVASKHAIEECHENVVDGGVPALQNFRPMLENELRMEQWEESDRKKCHYYGVVSSKSVYAQEVADKLKYQGVNGSTVSRPEVQKEVLFGQESSSGSEGIQAVNTLVPSMDTQLISAQSLKDCVQFNLGVGQSPTSNANINSAREKKVNVEKQMVVDKVSCESCSDVCGANDSLQPINEQGLDQMVPNYYKNSTVISNEIPEVTESTRISKMKKITVVVDKNIEHVTVVQKGPTKPGNGFNLESSQSRCTAQASELAMEENLIEDLTVTSAQPTAEVEHEELILETEREESCDMVQSKSIESPTRKLEGGFAFSSSDANLLEFGSVMECTDSQLVHVDEYFDEEQPPLRPLKHDPSNVYSDVGGDRAEGDVELPSDRGMIKGLISELSTLNKFIIGAWRDLESQRKKRQARLKSGKGKKLN